MKKGSVYLLSILADGEFYSGEELARQTGVSRAAIWKSIKQLKSLGLIINATRGKGYQLNNPLELLSENKIRKALSVRGKKYCHSIDILFNTSSTNSYLFNRIDSELTRGKVVLAEYQSQGKGRRGNKWLSPLASGIYLSIAWQFDKSPAILGLLSLYIGVAMIRALNTLNINTVGLKWPNDILINNEKLGGVLLEIRGESGGPVDVIIGVGLNYDLPVELISGIDQPVTDICHHSKKRLSRNKIAASLISNIFEVLDNMQNDTKSVLINEWRQYDCCKNEYARLILPDSEIHGRLKGVDDQGSLLMSVHGKTHRFTSGEISLRIE